MSEARLAQPAPAFIGHSRGARHVQAGIHQALRKDGPVLVVGPPGSGRLTVARVLHHFGGGEALEVDVVRARPETKLLGLGAFTYISGLEELTKIEQARIPTLVGAGRVVLATRVEPRSSIGRRRLSTRLMRWLETGTRIDIPGLAERREDLELLAVKLLEGIPTPVPIAGIADDALECLRGHAWPGEVDELRDVLLESVADATGPRIELSDLPPRVRVRDIEEHAAAAERLQELDLERVERRAIQRALAYTRGNRRQAALVLGIGKTTLYRKLREHGLS